MSIDTHTQIHQAMLDRLANDMKRNPAAQYDALKGYKITVPLPTDNDGTEGELKLTLGTHEPEKEEHLLWDGFAMLMGEVITASGHKFHAVIEICVEDSGEHYGSSLIVLYPEDNLVAYGTFPQDDPDLKTYVAELKKRLPDFELFPYRYRYLDETWRHTDHHVDPVTGWSVV